MKKSQFNGNLPAKNCQVQKIANILLCGKDLRKNNLVEKFYHFVGTIFTAVLIFFILPQIINLGKTISKYLLLNLYLCIFLHFIYFCSEIRSTVLFLLAQIHFFGLNLYSCVIFKWRNKISRNWARRMKICR